ncbi:MAG TPA: Smr/MutS family protein [Kofleriaceae bacterium]|nr:Smr/MutS family protein [Kofleriaceae bacterium]
MVTPADADTLAQLGWEQILADLARRCRTAPGAAAARGLGFAADAGEARARMEEIAEARALALTGAPLPLGSIVDVREPVGRAEKGAALEAPELIAVAETGRGCDRLRKHLVAARERAPRLAARAVDIPDLGHVFYPILEAFDEAGVLRDHASPELGGLRKAAARARADLDRRARDLVETMADVLQDSYFTQRDDRCVLPVKVESRWRVKGIVHGTSQSGATAFIEPEALVELGNALVLAQHAVADEERRILSVFTSYVAEEAAGLRAALAVAAALDLVAAAADQAEALDAAPPIIGDADAGVVLVRARHPLMELGGRACVPNDVRLARGSALVVSGPNAGGKTVALKTTGLAALMTRAGLHVTASGESVVPWFDRVLSDIGDAQSLEKDLSTFSGHLLRVEAVLREAGPGALVLFDELAVGTEPEQGAAMAQAALEALVTRGASVLVTTHYERLKALAAADPRFANASVGFDLERMAPTFELHLGVPGSSGALTLARRLEVDAGVVARAQELLGEGRAGVEELIASLAAERERVAATRAELEQAQGDARRAQMAAERAQAAAVERERRARQGEHDEAVAALRDARRELDELKTTVRRRRREAVARGGAGDGQEVTWLGAEVDAAAARIAAHAPVGPDPGAGDPPPDAAELRPGVRVRVLSLKTTGEVAAAPDGARVAVQVGALRTTVPITDVRVLSGRERRHQARAAAALSRMPRDEVKSKRDRDKAFEVVAAPNEGRALSRSPDATLDVRGERVDDAVAALDRFLDESLRAERELIFVIHGHGTGALRNAVRQHVKAHPAVSQFRPGEPNEGGDGVTIAWLG